MGMLVWIGGKRTSQIIVLFVSDWQLGWFGMVERNLDSECAKKTFVGSTKSKVRWVHMSFAALLYMLFAVAVWHSVTTSASDSSHWIVAGDPSDDDWSAYAATEDLQQCQIDTYNQAALAATDACGNCNFGHNITVSCCALDGSSGYRPDCAAYPKTFDEAAALCMNEGYRLCTLSEMMSSITRATGCYFDGSYNWVNDSCTYVHVVCNPSF